MLDKLFKAADKIDQISGKVDRIDRTADRASYQINKYSSGRQSKIKWVIIGIIVLVAVLYMFFG